MKYDTLQTATDRFVSLYQSHRASCFIGEHAASLARRDAAIARFSELGVPSRRDEEWKYSDLGAALQPEYTIDREARTVDRASLEPYFLSETGPRLVFINGVFAPAFSNIGVSAPGVTIGTIREYGRGAALPDALLDRSASLCPLPFARLNNALATDGVVIRLAREAATSDPAQILFITATDGAAVVSFPCVVVLAETSSQATIVENHIALGQGATLGVALTEIYAAANAHVDHIRTTELDDEAAHLGAILIGQARDSRVESCVIATGGRMVRHDFRVSLDGDGADCNLRGLSMLDGDEHVDNHLLVRHAAPRCTSREYFKNILDGDSRGVFCGRIHVDQNAQKTDGVQTSANLLLSSRAEAVTRPQLEIYADDVKCTHGATVGQIDEEAVFYMQARGVPEPEARTMLVRGFAVEILEEIRVEALRDRLKEACFTSRSSSPPALHTSA